MLDARLAERDFHAYEGVPLSTLAEQRSHIAPNDLAQNWQDTPSVESAEAVAVRFGAGLEASRSTASSKTGFQTLLVVSHASAVRAFIHSEWNLSEEHQTQFKLREGSYLDLEWSRPGNLELQEIWQNPLALRPWPRPEHAPETGSHPNAN